MLEFPTSIVGLSDKRVEQIMWGKIQHEEGFSNVMAREAKTPSKKSTVSTHKPGGGLEGIPNSPINN
jgi:hypothetical protein